MKRVNLRLLLILVAVVVCGGGAVLALHRYQVTRNAGNLAKLARVRLAEGKATEALNLLGRYVAYRPEDNEVYAEYARLVLDRAESPGAARPDIARAYAVLEAAVRRNPDDDALRKRLAEFQMRIGRASDAREHLHILRARAPEQRQPANDPAPPDGPDAKPAEKPLDRNEIDLLLARSWAGTGDFEEAANLASQVIGFDLGKKQFDPEREPTSGSSEAFVLLAAILQEKFDDVASADRVLAELVKNNPEDHQAWLAVARWHRQRGNLAAAKQDVAEATRLAPDDVEPLLAAFDIALAEGDMAAAQKLVDAGLKRPDKDERVIRAAAVLALQQQKPVEAVRVLDEGIEALPGRTSLLLVLADALLQTNDIPRGEKTIGKLKQVLGPASPAVGLLEARVLMAEQRWLKARQQLERVRPLVAASTELTRQVDLYLGQVHEQLGEFDEQLEANRRVLSDDPTSLAARIGAASALVAAGRPDEALEEFDLVARSIPQERVTSIPQIWKPLMQLRIMAQLKRPAGERDWSAIDGLLDALQSSPGVTDGQIALLRADVLVRKGEADTAVDLLTKAVAADPKDPQLTAALATLALRDNDVERVRAVIDAAPRDVADSTSVLLVETQLASRDAADQRDARLDSIESRAAALPAVEAARVLSALATVRFGAGQTEAAERLWSQALVKAPEDLRLRWTLFELARERGDLDAMQDRAADIGKAAGLDSPHARVARASTLLEGVRKSQKQLGAERAGGGLSPTDRTAIDEARSLLIEAENERPSWAHVQQLFAEIAGLRGDVPAAIDHLERASRMGPPNPSIIRQLVGLLYTANRFDEAERALARLGPEGLDGVERISAEMELRSGNIDEAVSLAEKSVSADSQNIGELLWLGQLLSRSGKTERAEDVLERAVEQGAALPEAWMTLFTHQFATGKRKLAERTLERASEALPEPGRYLVAAQGYEMLGRLDDAERSYREAITAAPDNLNASRGLAAFLLRRGRLNQARDVLGEIVDGSDDSPGAKTAKIWARRSLAELTAETGGYKGLEQALSIIDGNKGSDGKLGPDDVALQVELLAGRPEPSSWRRAIGLLETLSRSQPLSSTQRLQLAQLRERTGRWPECRDDMLSLVAASNVSPVVLGLLVDRLIEHGELSSAKIWLGKLKSAAPEATNTLALEARLAMAEKDRATAVAAARKLMPAGDVPLEQVGQLISVARLMEDLGFPKAADKVLTDFAQRAPDGAIMRAEFLGRQRRTQEALDLLETLWNRVPLARILQAALVVVRSEGGQPDAAMTARVEQWFSRARREDPDSLVLELLQAELMELASRGPEVEQAYRRILARSNLTGQQAAIVSNNLAFHLARPESATEAKKLIEDAVLELGPHPDLLDTRGVVKMAAGDTKAALADLEEAALSPSPAKLLHLAHAQVANNQLVPARQSIERARKMGLVRDQLSAADQARYDLVETALQSGPGA